MRMNGWLALAVAMGGLGFASSAQASDRDRADAPAGWKGHQAVRHWVYYPRYRHHYYTNGQTDPFGYDYTANGYYPYYNSGYWKARRDVPLQRAHFTPPKYYPAWGANRKIWHHYEWHAKHHGRHDHSQW